MAKQPDDKHVEVIGWFQPHAPYNWDGMVADPKTGELVKELSLTKQSFVAECDINNIIKDFTQTGFVAHINQHAASGAFVDLPDQIDFQAGLDLVRQASDAFAALPAKLRARFGNDPAQFLDFMHDPKNQQEAIDLGLAIDTRPPSPAPAEPLSGPKAGDPVPAPK